MNTLDCKSIENQFIEDFLQCDGKFGDDGNVSANVTTILKNCDAQQGQQQQQQKELPENFHFNDSCSNNNHNCNNTNTILIQSGNKNVDNGLVLDDDEEEEEEVEVENGEPLVDSFKSLTTAFCKDNEADSDDALHPLSERWSPLGANYDDAMSPTSDLLSPESELELLSSDSQDKRELQTDPADASRLKNMEEEQELLTTSLMALTSHFAHVQLRVRQIVEAPIHERDQLLKDLEEFAFRGIPDPLSTTGSTESTKNGLTNTSQHDEEATRKRQFELIEHLKVQLSELENIAYDSGAPVLPQHILLEKQKIIIDELKNKLNLKVEEHDLRELSTDELKNQVDSAIGEFVGPLKMKEQLVAQLKTQITDLERFIAFLQCDSDDSKMKTLTGNEKFNEAYNSYAAKKKGASARKKLSNVEIENDAAAVSPINPNINGTTHGQTESLNSKAHGLMDKASVLMQMFATTHFGTKAHQFQKNTLKKTSKGNHWGDLRAQLEVDIQEVASLAATLSFDKEKLANIKRTLKKKQPTTTSKSISTHNGTLSTIPAHDNTRVQPKRVANVSDLDRYTAVSSDDSDDEYDCYDWEKYRRRMVHNARQSGDSISLISKELTTAVRKNFAMTLQSLIEHGLRAEIESATSSLIVPFMRCLNPSPVFAGTAEQNYRCRESSSSFIAAASSSSYYGNSTDDASSTSSGFFSSNHSRQMHAWELILEYYYLKHGDEYNNTPARKLSQSFNLDIVDSKAVSSKQSLLSAIGTIIAMHRPYKRSYSAHFKAFVCAALNSHQLVEWLNLIFSSSDLIDAYYSSNSYVARTGFRDSLRSIDALSKYDFDLPVDLAVRHFRNI